MEIISIVNFEYTDKVDTQLLPTSVQELLSELEPKRFRSSFRVGDVVRIHREYPSIKLNFGDIGFVFHVSDSRGALELHTGIIFPNGEYAYWSKDEFEELEFVRHESRLEEYVFENAIKLSNDFTSGEFDMVFYDLE